MVNGIITAEAARKVSFENSKAGKRVLDILDDIQKAIDDACHKGKYEVRFHFPAKYRVLVSRVNRELEELGYSITVERKRYTTLNIKW